MALRRQIEDLRDHALESLRDAHDYFNDSQRAWYTLSEAVEQGGLTFSWQSFSTGVAADHLAILARAKRYTGYDLLSSTLQQFVSIFESFLFDALRQWLLAFPISLAKRQISAKEVLSLPDKPAILDALVEKELRDVLYDRPANWFQYLNDHVDVGAPSTAEADAFAELKATRDLLVHSRGIVNTYYVSKAGSAARGTPGDHLEITEPYHLASWQLLCKLVSDIGTGMAAKATL